VPAFRHRRLGLLALLGVSILLNAWSAAITASAGLLDGFGLIPTPVYGQVRSLSCEAAALQMALAAKSIHVSQSWLVGVMGADRRAPELDAGGGVVRWGDPFVTFVGSIDGSEPAHTGYGVYPPPVAIAAERAGASATALLDVDAQVLYHEVLAGNPVVVWVVNHLGTTALRAYTAWDGRTVPYSVGEHAMTLVGVDYERGTVTLHDPGNASSSTVAAQKFEASFNAMGRMAVVVRAGHPNLLPTADGKGYLIPDSDGGMAAFGDATSPGSLDGMPLNQAIAGAAATPTGHGVWLTAPDGGVFPLGDALGYGSLGDVRLNQPVVGIAATPSGRGYWLVAGDGGVFPFGDAVGYGSTGNIRLNQPMVGMAATPTGRGYWLVAADGGIFPFGDAVGYGSTGNLRLNQPVVGMAATGDGRGYWLVAADGGIFTFGNAVGHGSLGGTPFIRATGSMAATPTGRGYWLLSMDGTVSAFGDAVDYGSATG